MFDSEQFRPRDVHTVRLFRTPQGKNHHEYVRIHAAATAIALAFSASAIA
jgi:hypothetical protein